MPPVEKKDRVKEPVAPPEQRSPIVPAWMYASPGESKEDETGQLNTGGGYATERPVMPATAPDARAARAESGFNGKKDSSVMAGTASSESTIIRVSIGRIEVKTATPAPPAAPVRKKEPPKPRMSLEEFLSKRKSNHS
ncbi:hypothetical protein GCM10011511_09920 [Puia dinghuensis]|uniref:Uncharacterized protein n=2 Tax=Puia dinghuensis TaxID=1792502 RepID=A0A8J2UA80_9BACT|nr:hypothetical protein GCM10011511_09920 [Puia dinghuensis]